MKIGFVSMPLPGHLPPMTALAGRLQSRGNEVVFLGFPDSEAVARAANLDFVPIGVKEYPVGSVAKAYANVAKLHGEDMMRYTAYEIRPGLTKAALKHLPRRLADAGVEALVLDAAFFYLELVSMHLGIPYVHIWNTLHIDFSGATPACYFSWPHKTTPGALARNVEGIKILNEIFAPIIAAAKPYADKVGLQVDWDDPSATISKLAVITQTPKEFDFPIPNWPSQFYYTGPFSEPEEREEIPFPWEKLTNKPLIYVSLGTLVPGSEPVYRTILAAVGRFPEVQVVLSVGPCVNRDELGMIPANTIVVGAAPQIELLKRAAFCLTNAGLNTTLGSLAQGVPVVAIPIGYDQPGVAARVAYHGVGEFVSMENLTVERLSDLILQVLTNPGYRERARYFQKAIARANGLEAAAEVVELALGRLHPVDMTSFYMPEIF
jgi:zeaxanthin glucosyltransferase